MEIFAIDCGNKQTKMVSTKSFSENNVRVYPSYYVLEDDYPEGISLLESKRKVDKYSVSNFEDEVMWGQEITDVDPKVLQNSISFNDRHKSKSFKLLLSLALGKLASDYEEAEKGILEVVLVTGVPTNDFNEDTYKEMVRTFKGDHNIVFNGKSLNVRVKNIHVIDQPIGTIYDLMLDNEGYIINEEYLTSTVTVVDIGGGTLLIDTLKKCQVDRSMSVGSNTGVHHLFDEIVAKTLNKNIKGLSNYDVENIIRKGIKSNEFIYEKNKNESTSITDITMKSLRKFNLRTLNTISSTIKETDTIDLFIFTGGGSNIMNEKSLEEELKYVQIVEDSEIANVRGFFKFAVAQETE